MSGDGLFDTEKLRLLPLEPGVYLFRGKGGELLYIGKAKSLRRRVSSYFGAVRHPRRIARLVRAIASVEVITTLTEEEALAHEAHLIRSHQPPFNIALKYERPAVYLRLTAEAFPRLEVAHEVDESDGARIFGPYGSSWAMFLLKDTIDRHFQLRKRPAPIDEDRPRKPCWNYHLRRCHAPCAHRIGEPEYGVLVDEAVAFLRGERDALYERLRQKMWEASARLDYEWAAQYRDQIAALEKHFTRQQASLPEPEDMDVVAAFCDGGAGAVVLLPFRRGRLLGLQRLALPELEPEELDEALESFLKLHYAPGAELPPTVLLDRPLDEARALSGWLSKLAGRRVRLRLPRTGQEKRLLQMAHKNVELDVRARLAESGPERLLERLHRRLGLRRVPVRIECIDASNFQGDPIVASLVVCTGGKMDKSQYRRFRIEGLSGQDDFAAVGQVVARRLERMLAEDGPVPDLLLIDGGVGQLAAALEQVRARDLEGTFDVAALAKGRRRAASPEQRVDRVFLPGVAEPLDLRDEPSAMLLLQRIRDEAHRFAITYQRRLRGKKTLVSALDGVPGIGAVRKRELLRALGTVSRIASASAEELARVPGIHRRTAERIAEYFRRARASGSAGGATSPA